MTLSPLQPRSPSNINANVSPSKSKSLAVRKSISKPPINGRPPDRPASADMDMAEQMNEEISNKYVKGQKLGEGTYAVVYQGHLRSDPRTLVAIKKFKVQPSQQREGLNVDTIREIKYLQEISHPNIVALMDVFSSKDQNINMVIEYFPHGNLEELIKDSSVQYGAGDVKAWMGMLCRAVYYCHSNCILHRDIKPNNLLIAADGEVKLADFGLARSFADPMHNMTHVVITLWYRPPELLYGARHYSGAVDIWSTGMVFAELLVRRPWAAADVASAEELAQRSGEIAQLDKICEAVGTPTEDNWPGVTKLPNYLESEKKVPLRDRRFYQTQFPTAGAQGAELLMNMLRLDPRKRVTAHQALQHPWWSEDPRPTDKKNLPKAGGGAVKMAMETAKAPGAVVDGENAGGTPTKTAAAGAGGGGGGEQADRFKGVARKLDFGAMKK